MQSLSTPPFFKLKVFVLFFIFVIGVFACIEVATYVISNRTTSAPNLYDQIPLQEYWSFQTKGVIRTTPSLGMGIIVLRTDEGIHAVDLSSGESKWYVEIENDVYVSPALIVDDLVIVANGSDVLALDTATGAIRWETHGDSVQYGAIPVAYTDEYILVNRNSLSVDAYNRSNGNLAWRVDTGRGGTPVYLENGSLYILMNNQIKAIDGKTGSVNWEVPLGRFTASSFSSGILYYVETIEDDTYSLVAFSVSSREKLWALSLTTRVNHIVLWEEYLLASTERGILALNAKTGDELWEYNIGADEYKTPVVMKDVVYLKGAISRTIYALSIADGKYLGRIVEGDPAWIATDLYFEIRPVIIGDLLILPSGDRLFAYQSIK